MFFSRKQVQKHYTRNLHRDLSPVMDPDGVLNGQGREGLRDLSFGFSRVGHAGCESIAVYNALLMLRRPRPLPEIIRDMEKGGYLRLWGHMGAAPYFQPLLRRYGARSRLVSARRLEREAREGDLPPGSVFLFSAWNDRFRPYKGLHTFAGIWSPNERGGWVIFNRFNDDRGRRRYVSLDDVLRNGPHKGAWLVIYRVLPL